MERVDAVHRPRRAEAVELAIDPVLELNANAKASSQPSQRSDSRRDRTQARRLLLITVGMLVMVGLISVSVFYFGPTEELSLEQQVEVADSKIFELSPAGAQALARRHKASSGAESSQTPLPPVMPASLEGVLQRDGLDASEEVPPLFPEEAAAEAQALSALPSQQQGEAKPRVPPNALLRETVQDRQQVDELLGVGHWTPLVISEEHHDSIRYWYKAAMTSRIEHGSTLIHFDAHPDIQPPSRFDASALQSDDVKPDWTFFGRNDDYIMTAAARGVISSVVLVVPDWRDMPADLSPVAPDDDAAASSTVPTVLELGQWRTDPTRTCICRVVWDNGPQRRCGLPAMAAASSGTTDSGASDVAGTMDVPPPSCAMKTRLTFIAVRLKQVTPRLVAHMQELSASQDDSIFSPARMALDENKPDSEVVGAAAKAGARRPLIVDIDLDFFSTQPPTLTLNKLGMRHTVMNQLDRLVAKTFCPEFSLATDTAERLHNKLLSRMVRMAHSRRRSLKHMMKRVSSRRLFGFEKATRCPGVGKRRAAHRLRKIARLLRNIPRRGLKRLLQIGFCFRSQEGMYSVYPPFALCRGYTDDAMAIPTHVPTSAELRKTSATLTTVLQDLGSPALVSVARSVRDGFTPAGVSIDLEQSVLRAVQKIDSTRPVRVHYDGHLLGGPTGWPPLSKRHSGGSGGLRKRRRRQKWKRKKMKTKKKTRRTAED